MGKLNDLDQGIDKILRQKYALCDAIKAAIQTLEYQHSEDPANLLWCDIMIDDLQEALKQAIL